MKNFGHKFLQCLVSVIFAAFLILPCCQMVYAKIASDTHSCCTKETPKPCPFDSSKDDHSCNCSQAKNFLEIKGIQSLQAPLSQMHSYNFLAVSFLGHLSSQLFSAIVLISPPQTDQASVPLYLLHSILRI